MKVFLTISPLLILILNGIVSNAQSILYTMPEETEEHEGTWIQWPHNYLYGPYYRDDVESTFIEMTSALQEAETVQIIAYDSTELNYINDVLTIANIPFDNINFFVHKTDDVWSRDNGPMFVYDQNNDLTILDWGFNGWGFDTPYTLCDIIPQSVSADIGIPIVDLNGMVLEGGAIEHDGHGTMIATRSSITHSSRNPTLTEAQIEDTLTTYMGISKFIWVDESSFVTLDIYTALGKHIQSITRSASEQTIVLQATDFESGIYYYSLKSQGKIIGSSKMIINH